MKMKKGFGILLSLALTARAGEWRVARDLLGESSETAVAAVTLDAHVFKNSQPGWADVRVLDSEGRDVPRVIQPERNYTFEERHTPRAAKITQLEQMPDGGLAVVCEIERTNAVSLTQVTVHTPLRDYEQTMTVTVPGPDGAWLPVREAEPLFDYSRFADVKKETVELPSLTNRLFRLVIGQADDKVFSTYTTLTEASEEGQTAVRRSFKRYRVERRPFRIDTVTFCDTERNAVAKERKRERITVSGVQVTEDAKNKATVLTFEAGHCPAVGVALVPEQQNFERQVTVECFASGNWRMLGRGALSRVRLPGVAPRERLALDFPETRAGQVRVRILNDDNPPLTFAAESVNLLVQTYRAAFIAEKGQRYRLVYGDPRVTDAPVYEQSVTTFLCGGQEALAWSLATAPEGAVTYGAGVRLRQLLAKRGMLLLSILVMTALGGLILRAVRHVERR